MVLATPDTGPPSIFAGDGASRIANYDRAWSSYIDSIASHAARSASLAELVSCYDAVVGDYTGFIAAPLLRQITKIDLGRFAGSPPPQRLAVVDGHYVASPAIPSTDAILDAIAGAVGPEVDCIVEFGSGLGVNLARLRLRLPSAPLTYIACEPTAQGRRAAEVIFSVDPLVRLDVRPFDYAAADLGFLARFRNIVAFTVHSVEQMPVLGDTFYRALLDTNTVHCFHLEPVGWQRFTNIAETVLTLHRDPQKWQQFCQGYEYVVEDSQLVTNAAMWSAACGYNTDLLSLVAAAIERGEVALAALAYEIVGTNPFNPSTLIAWRRIRNGDGGVR
jgi:hypothetical protein